jgi:cation:H+ antiporter
MLVNFFLYIISFVVIWFGAGFIISSVSNFSRKMRFSSFAVSFVLLGILTSTPELGVGLQAVSEHKPEIFIGNLIGGIPVLFLFVVPVLAILGNGINLRHEIDNKTLFITLLVVLAPTFMLLDQKLTTLEGAIMVVIYFLNLLLIEKRRGILDGKTTQILNTKAYSSKDLIKMLVGIVLVFISSKIIVDKTIFFSTFFGIAPYYISLLAISIGTNLPELSLAVRSIYAGKKDIAMGDYIGSAAANTLLFGIFTLLSEGDVVTNNNFSVTLVTMAFGLGIFYIFALTDNKITRKEGIALFLIFILFGAIELLR